MYSYHGVTLILFISTDELQYRRTMVPIRISRNSPPEIVVVNQRSAPKVAPASKHLHYMIYTSESSFYNN